MSLEQATERISLEPDSTSDLFRNRLVLITIAILSFIVAFAWNDFFQLHIKKRILEGEGFLPSLYYTLLMTVILVLVLAVLAWWFGKIYNF